MKTRVLISIITLLALLSAAPGIAKTTANTSFKGKTYYVNTNPQGNNNHEVHSEDCKKINLNKPGQYMKLGTFTNCRDAVREAQQTYPDADGCYFCSRKCHVR